ncbi:MAG: response regulator [Candidatus Eremiobacterota bacterium]
MNKYTILLVDDDRLILKAMALSVKNKGYSVVTAGSGEEAISILAKQHIDLVITDLVMEQVGGLEVLRKAKEIDSEIMVIILTGYGDITSAIEALRFDADDYLMKPCEDEEIYFKIAGLLEKQDLRRKIKIYEKILPVCSVCKQIRDDTGKIHGSGDWMSLETYVCKKSGIELSHTYCPVCKKKVIEEMEREFQ